MKILVPIKRVVDYNVRVRIKPDETGVMTDGVKMSINPFDEIAIEEAIRLKEKNQASEIITVSIGSDDCQEILRNALALGADRAILIRLEETLAEPLNIAKLLAALVAKEAPQLVILGKQSIDGDNNQTGQMLAALLGWPQGTFISKLTLDNLKVEVIREVDGGLETLRFPLPAVVTTDLRLNEPRYATLPNIMKAKRKPLEILDALDLHTPLQSHSQLLKVTSPAERKSGIKVATVAELVAKLKNEAGVL